MKTILFIFGGLGLATFAFASQPISMVTMTNLQAAFNGESNAHARYIAYAQKADMEGYAGVAGLFRAAARAEEIHAGNHRAVIQTFGGVAEAKLGDPVIRSTRENLDAAIQGETYERDEMYRAFIRQAQTERHPAALRTFTFARAAEAEHAKLFTEALQDMETMRDSRVYYVCPICGFTTPKVNFESCPTCATPKERFEQVS